MEHLKKKKENSQNHYHIVVYSVLHNVAWEILFSVMSKDRFASSSTAKEETVPGTLKGNNF